MNTETLIAAHRTRAVLWALKYLRNREDAEDAVQRACIVAYVKAHQFRGRTWSTWFYTIVRTECLMFLRRKKEKREDSLEEIFGDSERKIHIEPIDWETPEAVAARNERFDIIETRIKSLSPALPAGLKVALAEDKKTGAVKACIWRARNRLREMLCDENLEELMVI